MPRRIYLDYNASTPIAREVAAAMRPFLDGEAYGNPSSQHWASTPARAAIDNARAQVASLLGANTEEIVLLSGGTEASNCALKGTYFARGKRDAHFVISAVEHPATVKTCAFLEMLGASVTVVPVDAYGRVDPDDVKKAITKKTVLVSIMHANNEVGTIQPIREIADLIRPRGVLLHVDCAQSTGKISTRVSELRADLISIAGHKLYAPKGVGALYIREGVELEPLLHGGGHEHGRRAGTESALMCVGLGAACDLAKKRMKNAPAVRALRDRLFEGLRDHFGDEVVLNGHPELRLPNTLNVSFVGRVGAEVLAALEGVAASTGAACHAGEVVMSPVLKAMGVPPKVAMGAVRLSLGYETTAAEIDAVIAMAKRAVTGHVTSRSKRPRARG
jgi:cysteine desulfurase